MQTWSRYEREEGTRVIGSCEDIHGEEGGPSRVYMFVGITMLLLNVRLSAGVEASLAFQTDTDANGRSWTNQSFGGSGGPTPGAAAALNGIPRPC